MTKHPVLTLALLLASCAPTWTYAPQNAMARPPIRVCLEAPDTSGELAQAVHAWDKAIGNWRHMVVSHAGCDVVIFEGQCTDGNPLACADGLGGTVVTLVPGKYEHDRTAILLHELGHILGAQHVEGTLMSSTYAGHYTCPDIYTVLQVSSYQKANLTEFSWCF